MDICSILCGVFVVLCFYGAYISSKAREEDIDRIIDEKYSEFEKRVWRDNCTYEENVYDIINQSARQFHFLDKKGRWHGAPPIDGRLYGDCRVCKYFMKKYGLELLNKGLEGIEVTYEPSSNRIYRRSERVYENSRGEIITY